ncbi:pentatricopeptide repeat-containing protein At3g57430, chloroplastic isoform X2 [Ricinus communis]|uniref:pentatricopeptide repeat-containing protein At3g57430, chloroplastic isoform X2 n=1 Tax=Ricinus communis TaxID=3988 RepID=UPI00201A439A|nr:pentatricopeptide repeat-containing protein At3g57430, chloroplastic isoform X2 [Ricinus communis]
MYISLSLKPAKVPSFDQQTQLKTDPKKVDWSATIKYHAKLRNDNAILSTYMQMESLDVLPDNSTLPLIFKACTRLNAFERGKKIHSSIEGTNLIKDVKVGTAVVDFYCKCGHVTEASEVFGKMNERDLVLWNAMISGYVGCGYFEGAIWLFKKMRMEGFVPNSRTLVALILACEGLLEMRLGKEIHGYCLRNGFFYLYPHVGTALIGFYLNFGVRISSLVFDLMVVRSAVSWNAMITGFFDAEDFVKALELFVHMVKDGIEFDMITILVVIQASADFGSLQLGMQIHQMAIKLSYVGDLFIQNALLNMYAENGSLKLACHLFDNVITRDVALWNSMISAYIDYAYYEEANSLFSTMRTKTREDERTIAVMLSLCAEAADGLKMGKSLHALACKNGMRMDNSTANALLRMYADLNCAESALKVFNEMSDVDVVSYNTLILALCSSNLRVCGDETCLNIGRSIHGFVVKQGIETNLSWNTSLADMYISCGDETTAKYLFEICPDRDLILWNAMIAAFLKKNKNGEALLFFNRMISEEEPNSVTIINVLSTCSDLANLPYGQCLHAYAARRYSPISLNLSLANAFITMYARCGSMQNAEKIFKTLPKRDIISWNTMITGYGTHGSACDAILAFMQMLEDGFRPNGVTFLSILSACRHAGLIEKGLQLFNSMVQDFKMTPSRAHYGCVVDLLCRSGRLDEAREFINAMPIEPDASIWRALLSACRVHSNIKLASEIFEHLVTLEPENAGNYILLCNLYAAAGLWSEVRKIRTWTKEKGLKKPPGSSWIAIRGQTHSFTAGDTSHTQSEKIYEILNSLLVIIRGYGYITDKLDNEED